MALRRINLIIPRLDRRQNGLLKYIKFNGGFFGAIVELFLLFERLLKQEEV